MGGNTNAQYNPDEEDIVFEDENPTAQIKDLRQKLRACEALKQEYLEGWQRTKADFVNANRKSEEEKKNFAKYATQNLLGEIIPVLDSFEMAFKADFWKNADGTWKAGIERICEQLKFVLTQNGVQEINPPIGELFNPQLQEAVFAETVASKDKDNTVTETVQTGYKLHDRVIRPAKVKVGEYRE